MLVGLPYRPAGVDKNRQVDPTSRRADSPSREGGGGPAYRPAALDSKRPGDPTSSRRADSSPKRPSPEDIRFQECSISQMFLVCNLREANLRMNVGANTQKVLSSILGVICPQYPDDTVLFFLFVVGRSGGFYLSNVLRSSWRCVQTDITTRVFRGMRLHANADVQHFTHKRTPTCGTQTLWRNPELTKFSP